MTTANQLEKCIEALQPLANIWQAYLTNDLDNEARRFWGVSYEHENQTAPEYIELYAGRGGKRLLTLADCRNAAATITMLRMHLDSR